MAGVVAALCTGCATAVPSNEPGYVTGTEASVVAGVVSDTGGDVEYWVEYGPTTAYGSETAHDTENVQPNQVQSVFRVIEGLQRATTYHYRFCARDSTQQGGPGCTEDRQFTTVNVDCGDEITADLQLSADLNCIPADAPSALVVAANGVDVDLEGHTVLNHGGGPAIDNRGGYDDVTVRDGELESFDAAVRLTGASRNRLLRMRIGDGYPGLPGTQTGLGIAISGGEDNVIRDADIHGDAGGLEVTDSDRLLVAGSELSARFGFPAILNADFARIRDSRLSGDHSEGLMIRGSGNRVRGSEIGGLVGVHVQTGESNIIAENQVAAGARFPIGDADNNPVGDGIHVAAAAAGTVLRANVANGSQGDGIEVLSPSTRLRDNTANQNVLWGIDAVLGVIDLGGNTATGNGAGQCRNVTC